MPEMNERARDVQATSVEASSSPAGARRARPVFLGAFLVAIAAALAAGCLGGRAYVVASFVVVISSIVPFFAQFEQRRPQAREVVLVAVMCALVVASRAAFVWVPNFKPMAAVVMISGMALGASSGFLVGSVGMLASDFMFGQGPWLPWQMLSYGVCGFFFGLLADKGALPRSGLSWKQRLALGLGGALFVVAVAGPILDTSSLFLVLSTIAPESAIAVYLAGLPVNCMQAVATFATLTLLAEPMLDKLHRVCEKHGLMGQ